MKRKAITTSLITAMAVVPGLMKNTKKMTKDMVKAGKKSSKMLTNKMDGRKTTAMLVTGLGGYLLAHAAPIRTLIRER